MPPREQDSNRSAKAITVTLHPPLLSASPKGASKLERDKKSSRKVVFALLEKVYSVFLKEKDG